jgi:hypothetical protein
VGYGDLFHFGRLWTLVLVGVGGGDVMYGGLICRNFVSRSDSYIVVVLWYMHSILMASGSMRGSLFNSRDMVGSLYIIVSGVTCMMTCVSSNLVLDSVSFVVHSSSGMVRIVIVSWFSCTARTRI